MLELTGIMMNDNEFAMVAPRMKNGSIADYVRKTLRVNPLKLVRDMFCLLRQPIELDRSFK
jgi:hypothetical protein